MCCSKLGAAACPPSTTGCMQVLTTALSPRRYAKFVEDATLTFTMLFFVEMILKYDCP